MKKFAIALLAMLFSIISYAQTSVEAVPLKISDRKIIKSTIVNMPVDLVWWKWTTHEGLLTFFGEDNKVELTPGGAYEIYFNMDVPAGSRGAEGCTVLSYIPERMLSFTWNAPPKFREARESPHHTWVVVEFKSLCEDKTQVTLTHLGWPEDEDWNGVYLYFAEAWDSVMSWLRGPNLKTIQIQ